MRKDGQSGSQHTRWRYHYGVPTLIYIFVTLLVALGAFNSQNNLLFWGFGFSLSMLIVSGVVSRAMLMGIELERLEVTQPRAGEVSTISYRVRNTNRLTPAFALAVVEVPTSALRGWARKARQRGKDGAGAAAADWAEAFSSPMAFVGSLGAGRGLTITGTCRGRRRGRVRFGAVLVSTSFPMGFIKKSLLFQQPLEVIVQPARIGLPETMMRQAIRLGERGVTPTRRLGMGAEFFALREYLPGDQFRSIAWRASARRGELLVRQTAAPSPVRLVIVLDLGVGADAEADERAISGAGSFIDSALDRGLEIGLRIPGAGVDIRPREGRLQRSRLLDELGVLDAGACRRGDLGAPPADMALQRAAFVVFHSGAPSVWAEGLPDAMHAHAEDFGGSAEIAAEREGVKPPGGAAPGAGLSAAPARGVGA